LYLIVYVDSYRISWFCISISFFKLLISDWYFELNELYSSSSFSFCSRVWSSALKDVNQEIQIHRSLELNLFWFIQWRTFVLTWGAPHIRLWVYRFGFDVLREWSERSMMKFVVPIISLQVLKFVGSFWLPLYRLIQFIDQKDEQNTLFGYSVWWRDNEYDTFNCFLFNIFFIS
jgi:hypothetical protein